MNQNPSQRSKLFTATALVGLATVTLLAVLLGGCDDRRERIRKVEECLRECRGQQADRDRELAEVRDAINAKFNQKLKECLALQGQAFRDCYDEEAAWYEEQRQRLYRRYEESRRQRTVCDDACWKASGLLD